MRIVLSYRRAEDFAAALRDMRQRRALVVTFDEDQHFIAPVQFDRVTLAISVSGRESSLEVRFLQLLGEGCAVFEMLDLEALADLAAGATEAASPEAPIAYVADAQSAAKGWHDPLSLSQERLRQEWPQLSLAQRLRLAKYGKRHARTVILRSGDRKLAGTLLINPGLSAEEVALLAAMPAQDPDVLRRIVGNADWLRHPRVVRNLVCNPRITSAQLTRLLPLLAQGDLRRIARRGKVRAEVKRQIIRLLEKGR